MDHLTLAIEQIDSKEILKDIFYQDELKALWPSKSSISPVYDSENHGVSCKCCSKIIKESITCPTKIERARPRYRGRSRLAFNNKKKHVKEIWKKSVVYDQEEMGV